MPTGLRNVVCDECHGGRMVYMSTGEIQIEHDNNCMFKYREDTFLIDLVVALNDRNPKGPFGVSTYPDVKLNPIIYDMLCDNRFTYYGNKTFAKKGQSMAQKRSQRINENFQIVKQSLKDDGRWDNIKKEFIMLQKVEFKNKDKHY